MKTIMVQGTSSSAGKTTLVAGLCRILAQEGKRVCPFKSQNMALNSYVDEEGRELSRATAMQAEAAKTKPSAWMNPILLKPNEDNASQVLALGKPFATLGAKEYFNKVEEWKKISLESFQKLAESYDYCVLEGGGSPAEINLRDYDFVNMGMAELVDAPVLLIANIETGGVFASLYGTVALLEEKDRARIKGMLINNFRGDDSLLEPGIKLLEKKLTELGSPIPVLGVLPHLDLHLEEEDSLSHQKDYENSLSQAKTAENKLILAIIQGKQLGNQSDFEPLEQYDDVLVRYIRKPEELGEEDLIILPGSKNTLEEVENFHKSGLSQKIKERYEAGTPILGICGGFQALGKSIHDPQQIDGKRKEVAGLDLLPMKSIMKEEKILKQVKRRLEKSSSSLFLKGREDLLKNCYGLELQGYEIHHGRSSQEELIFSYQDIYGSYLHGLFENNIFTKHFLNNLRKRKSLTLQEKEQNYLEFKEKQFNYLAEQIRLSINLDSLYQIFFKKD